MRDAIRAECLVCGVDLPESAFLAADRAGKGGPKGKKAKASATPQAVSAEMRKTRARLSGKFRTDDNTPPTAG